MKVGVGDPLGRAWERGRTWRCRLFLYRRTPSWSHHNISYLSLSPTLFTLPIFPLPSPQATNLSLVGYICSYLAGRTETPPPPSLSLSLSQRKKTSSLLLLLLLISVSYIAVSLGAIFSFDYSCVFFFFFFKFDYFFFRLSFSLSSSTRLVRVRTVEISSLGRWV
jgi:hypothetical protein